MELRPHAWLSFLEIKMTTEKKTYVISGHMK